MAHLGGVYYQTVSAIAKSQELMVSFPLSHRPFSRLELNESERRRFHLQATELLGDALREYEEFALIRHRQVDRRRWKPVKNHENIAVYRESRSYAVSRSLSVEDEKTFARAAAMAPISSSTRRRVSRSSSSSGGSGSGSISTIHELPAHQATELELLTGWGPTATEVREHKKRNKSRSASVSGNLEQLPTLLGVGNIVGSLDDVMYGVAAPDCASMALKNAYAHEDVLDGDILCAIEGPSQRSPFRFLGIKWLVKSTTTGAVKNKLTSPRDLVYLEATGVITRGDGVRIGYQIMHSVKLLGFDVFLKSNVAPNGKVSESVALQSCANSLLYCGKTVQCSQDKKLTWQLQCNQSIDRQGTNVKPTRCSICNKSFGRFLRHSIECKLCSTVMCSKCCVERTLKSVDASAEKEEEDIRDTFDSFGDLIDIHDDLDDVVETLDTKDMEAVKRASQPAQVMSDDGDSRLETFLAVVEKFEIELDDPVETAEEFQDLEELDLSEKGLTELPGDLVLALPPNLKTLALEKNGLVQLPENFGSDAASSAAWGQLTELYLRDNELEKLPAAIGELSKLESLYLEDNKLTSDGIPNEIAQLSSTLAGLCLHRNLLTTFPVSLCQLIQLEELYLDDNALEFLPEEFGMLTNLKELDILGNKLTTLPDSFKNLHKLEILHAERNQLVKLPKHLGELQSLRKVYLQNNCLTKLHSSLGRCMKLEVINIEDNSLAKVAKRIGDLPKLKHLLLANNNITELPFNPIEKNPNLRRLTLKGNQLAPEILELEKQVAMAKVTEEEENED
ncbi:hypothetical protein JG688_00000978 [Phytophthora aleatoria]|uniref:Disease resistance R13L4/SHOC-2-like LRR domain-containing protein n=1 Tax=Phytophthora aleatoria TaxID=2496075 RepID=A0A8J5MBU9_9STRA|nr:hypothetical protein JG688_00000978 [Phytophthora aleatoria]